LRNRAFRPIAAILSILLFAGTRVYAGPVAISDVIQALGAYQTPTELRLRSVSQTNSQIDSMKTGRTVFNVVDSSAPDIFSANSLLAGIATNEDEASHGVGAVAAGDFEGTICDCGEITVPGGGFPKWPLVFLAAIPLIFIHDCDDCDQSTPTPTPTPPPTHTPEPASLLLLGSGLAAFGSSLRRRYARAKETARNTEEG
jgi:PEP-CTERM motif-containing protein